MGISIWQSVCIVLLGAILAVWMDEGSNQIFNLECSKPAEISGSNPIAETDPTAIVDPSLEAMAEAQWIKDTSELKGAPLNFLRDPKGFIARFQSCTTDPRCHVMYHHVSKTGGTTLEQALFPVFGQDVMHTCCHQRLRQRFFENPEEFCNLKFSSWQMFDDEFLEVVHTCQQADPKRRSLLLTTFREPTRTLLSYIHQMCNKLLHKRTIRVREACEACLYENSTDVWHFMAFIIQRQITGAYRVSRSIMDTGDQDEYYVHHNSSTATVKVYTPHEHKVQNFTLDKTRLQVLTMETNDVDSFLWHWQPESIFGVANPEKAGRCSFRLTTELLKELRPALSTYRKLLTGL
uniref:Sulfotransferase n=1 Tax=Amphora coffeiformis TaxID=265554 RepID=A0A7S3P7W5_9STRA